MDDTDERGFCDVVAIYERGRSDALDAARDAVAALPYGTGTFWPKGKWLDRDEALAAIDKGGRADKQLTALLAES